MSQLEIIYYRNALRNGFTSILDKTVRALSKRAREAAYSYESPGEE